MKRLLEEDTDSNSKKKVCTDNLQLVRPSDVPEYLRDTEFYRSLDTEDDEAFYILGSGHLKLNMDVNSLDDARDLLRTARFWGLKSNVIIEPIVLCALTSSLEEIKSELGDFVGEFHFVQLLIDALDSQLHPSKRVEAAMELGVFAVVRRLDISGGYYTVRAVELAAAGGHCACLEYALSRNVYAVYSARFDGALANGQLNCVKLIVQKMHQNKPYGYISHHFCGNIIRLAAKYGQLECLIYLHQRGCFLDSCAEPSAASGSLQCLKYVVERRRNGDENSHAGVCDAAARNGHLPSLKYLHEQSYPLSESICTAAASALSDSCLNFAHRLGGAMPPDVCIAAASAGSLSCLKYFQHHGGVWHYMAIHAAALHGHLSCLQYAHEHGCPWLPDKLSTKENREYRGKFEVKHSILQLVEQVAQRKHWGCVLYLIMQNFPLTRLLSVQLVRKHKDSMLQLAVEHGCELAADVGVRYAKVGNLNGLMFAMQHGCEPSQQILCAAARRGNLYCLQHAHEQGCPWSREVCVAAARGGHLECLQYAREHGCPWGRKVHEVAAKKNHTHILAYARVNKCPGAEEVRG